MALWGHVSVQDLCKLDAKILKIQPIFPWVPEEVFINSSSRIGAGNSYTSIYTHTHLQPVSSNGCMSYLVYDMLHQPQAVITTPDFHSYLPSSSWRSAASAEAQRAGWDGER